MSGAYDGACFCGDVHFTIAAEPLYACHCHCRSCQQAAGAAFVTWATFPARALRISAGGITDYHSSTGVTRGFCKRCGTTLTYAHADRPGEIDITVASLESPARISPQSHIWMEDSIAWLAIDDGLPQYLRKVTS